MNKSHIPIKWNLPCGPEHTFTQSGWWLLTHCYPGMELPSTFPCLYDRSASTPDCPGTGLKKSVASALQPFTRWSEFPDVACTWVGFLLLSFIASIVFVSIQKTQFDATWGQQKCEHQDSSALKFRGSTMHLSLLITLQLILVGLGFLFPYESNKPPLISLASGSHVCKS